MTKISVCMATYNGEKYLVRQLESILSQIAIQDEVIVSDDSSFDNTENVVFSFEDKRIKFVKNYGAKGPVGNFQNALTHATGDVIFLCDQDDVWLPGKTATMVKLLESYDLVVSDCIIVDEKLNEIQSSFFSLRGSKRGLLFNLYKNSYMGCCMAFRKDILIDALPFPRRLYMHDWWIGLIAECNGNVYFHKSPLIMYVRHGNNVSPTGESSLGWLRKIYNRLIIIAALIKRIYIK